MEIIKTNLPAAETVEQKKQQYRLFHNQGVNLSALETGTVIPVKDWAYYTDTNNDGTGEVKDIVVLTSTDGTKYQSISGTFIHDFLEIADLFQNDFSIVINQGHSKKGRTFVTCNLA